MSEKSAYDKEQERRRRRLGFIALVALITTVLLALAAAIPFLLGEIHMISSFFFLLPALTLYHLGTPLTIN